MNFTEFVDEAQRRLQLPDSDRAVRAVRATLSTLGSHLPEEDVAAIAASLPPEIQWYLTDAVDEHGQQFGWEEFVARVSDIEDTDPETATAHARGIIQLVETVAVPSESAQLRDRLRESLDEESWDALFEAGEEASRDEQPGQRPDSEGTLLVAVANLETAERLLDTAVDVATDRSYDILLTYVVEVPAQLPLSEGDRLLNADDRDVLDHAEQLIESADVHVESRIRYARDVARGIVGGAAEYDADLVLMGWRGRPPRRNVALGSYLDTVLRNAPCDVLFQRIKTPRPTDVERILVPVAGGAHSQFAMEMAASVARCHDASVTLLHVLPEEPAEADREAAETLLEEGEAFFEGVEVTRQLPESNHVPGQITDETAAHDVTVIGTSEESVIRRKLLGTVSEAVGRHAAGTVLIAQRHPSTPSRLRRSGR